MQNVTATRRNRYQGLPKVLFRWTTACLCIVYHGAPVVAFAAENRGAISHGPLQAETAGGQTGSWHVATAGDPIIWDNGENAGGAAASQLDTVYPFDAQVADDFLLCDQDPCGGSDFVVTGIDWVGTYFNGYPGNPLQGFNVLFYADAGCVPTGSGPTDPSGTALLNQYIPYGDVNETPTGGTNEFAYSADLVIPFLANCETRYWVAIQAVMVFPPQWGWNESTEPFGCESQQGFPLLGLDYWTSIVTDRAFKLRGFSAAPPPVGACCVTEDDCQILNECECDLLEGDYKGDATACENVDCSTCPSVERQRVVLGGDKDDFASAGDPADVIYMRPDLEADVNRAGGNNDAYHGGQSLPFDVPNPDNWNFGYTFPNLPTTIAAATLTVHLRAGSSTPATDALRLQWDAVSQSYAWSHSLNGLDNIFGNGAPWSFGDDMTVVLDLADVPLQAGGTIDLLPLISADGFLDVIVLDDTGVDYVELAYEYCPCSPISCPSSVLARVRLGGTDDGFALPTDPASPGVEMLALGPCGGGYKDFDDLTVDSCMGHTITGLPKQIASATLTIALKAASSGAECNDGISVQVEGGAFVWGRRIGTGGPFPWCGGPNGLLPTPWTSGSTATFVLDLSALPNADGTTTCILDQLSETRRLDVRVADDSAVDYMQLDFTYCPPTRFGGLANWPLGNAVVEFDPDGNLIVGNIGASGDDGVHVDLGVADGFSLRFDGEGQLPPPNGAYMDFVYTGTVEDTPDQVIGSSRLTVLDPLVLEWATDFSPVQAGQYLVAVYKDEALVYQELLPNSPDVQIAVPDTLRFYNAVNGMNPGFVCLDPFDPDFDFGWFCQTHPEICSSDACADIAWIGLESDAEFQWNDQSWVGDEVVIAGMNPNLIRQGVGGVDVFAADIDTFIIQDVALLALGHPNRALGEATFDSDGQSLVVWNIGSSGQDGLSVHWEDDPDGRCPTCPQAVALEWDDLDPNEDVGEGAFIEFAATGRAGGQPGMDLGSMRITRLGPTQDDGAEITVDYSPVGSDSHQIEVYDQGALVGVVTGHTGTVASIRCAEVYDWRPDPDECEKGLAIIDGQQTACFFPHWPDTLTFDIVGGPSLQGNAIRVLAEAPDAEFEALQSFSIRLAGYEQLNMTEQSQQLPLIILDAQSCLDHNGVELCLDLEDTNGIEPRVGGPTKVLFTVNQDMDPATVSCANVQFECSGGVAPACASASLIDPRVIELALAGAQADGDCCRVSFDGMTGTDGAQGITPFDLLRLEGDLNFSSGVTGGDAAIIKLHFGEIAGLDLDAPQWDFNRDGGVTGGDFSLIKPLFGHIADECP